MGTTIHAWAAERAAAGDDEALQQALEEILRAYLQTNDQTYVWGKVGEAFVKAQAALGEEFPEEDLGIGM